MAVSISYYIFICVAAAFSVDTAYMQLTRTEMRSAVDAAARGAGQVLSSGGSDWSARQTAKDMAARHRVAGRPLQPVGCRYCPGQCRASSQWRLLVTSRWLAQQCFPDCRQTHHGSIDGQINSIFGGLLGVSRYNSQQSATVVRGDRDVMLVLDTSGSMMYRLDIDMNYPLFRDGTTPPDPWFRPLGRAGSIARHAHVDAQPDSTNRESWLGHV